MNQKLKKIQLFVAVGLLLVSVLMLFRNPGITGYVSADFKSQVLNLDIDESQSFLLTTNSEEPIYITSFRVEGEVVGDGSVEILIDNNRGQQVLVYKNIAKKEQGLPAITGMAVSQPTQLPTSSGESAAADSSEQVLILLQPLGPIVFTSTLSLSEEEEFVQGIFKNKCVDSCFIEMPVSASNSYEIVFNIKPGTKVKLTKLIYSIKDDMVG